MKVRIALSVLIVAILAGIGTVTGLPLEMGQAASSGPQVVVYNANLALIREKRRVTLKRGVNLVEWTHIPRAIKPASVHFRSLTDPQGTQVLAQAFLYDVADAGAVLRHYVGRPVRVVLVDGTVFVGTLLAAEGDVILQLQGGELVVLAREQVQRFDLEALSKELVAEPTLRWQVQANRPGVHEVEVTYLTEGLTWQAHYTLRLAADESLGDLTGWATVDNRSGVDFPQAQLTLVAGDVRRETTEAVSLRLEKAAAQSPAAGVVEQPFFEYHVYRVQGPVSLLDNQSVQVNLVAATGLAVKRTYVARLVGLGFQGGVVDDPRFAAKVSGNPQVVIEFPTGEGTPIDRALPAGLVRVYQEDQTGVPLFVGEARIRHTPAGEVVRLPVGNAFDIVVDRTQVDFTRLGPRSLQEQMQIVVRNHKEEAVTVQVVEPLYRAADWEIVQASQPYEKVDAHTVHFAVSVPAGEEKAVTYTVRYRW